MLFLFLVSCSSAYKELTKYENKEPVNFQEYVLHEYKLKAKFEAEEMHDWNSAKLYSEKAILSLNTDQIYPEEISYWRLPAKSINEISVAHESLKKIYDEAKIIDPYNLAKAIASLDCWSEQQEENWQSWDIDTCKNNFLASMHILYNKLMENNNKNKITKKMPTKNKTENATIITKDKYDKLLHIIYFDFDETSISESSKRAVETFLKNNRNYIYEYLIVGHTDTKGSKKYNLNLSIKRANVVKDIFVENKVDTSKIKILGEGEESLAIVTPDNTKHPANRRVEIKKSN